jgi:hypothetical protein
VGVDRGRVYRLRGVRLIKSRDVISQCRSQMHSSLRAISWSWSFRCRTSHRGLETNSIANFQTKAPLETPIRQMNVDMACDAGPAGYAGVQIELFRSLLKRKPDRDTCSARLVGGPFCRCSSQRNWVGVGYAGWL